MEVPEPQRNNFFKLKMYLHFTKNERNSLIHNTRFVSNLEYEPYIKYT